MTSASGQDEMLGCCPLDHSMTVPRDLYGIRKDRQPYVRDVDFDPTCRSGACYARSKPAQHPRRVKRHAPPRSSHRHVNDVNVEASYRKASLANSPKTAVERCAGETERTDRRCVDGTTHSREIQGRRFMRAHLANCFASREGDSAAPAFRTDPL